MASGSSFTGASLQPRGKPLGPCASTRHLRVHDEASCLHSLRQDRSDSAASSGDDEHYTRHRILECGCDTPGLRGRDPSRVADHDDSTIGEKRRCGDRVDDGAGIGRVSALVGVLFDDHRCVTFADQIRQDVAHALSDQGRVVAANQDRRVLLSRSGPALSPPRSIGLEHGRDRIAHAPRAGDVVHTQDPPA